MKRLSTLRTLLLGGLWLAAAAGPAAAQTAASFPNKPIRIVVPFGAGTTTDQAARFIGQRITEQTKQPVIVDNKAGANGFIALQYLLQQPADGYTIVIGTNTTHAANSALFKKLPYDAKADFDVLLPLFKTYFFFTTAADSKYKNMADLVADAKASPGKINFASGGIGTGAHLALELFNTRAGVDVTHVPYKGNGPATSDLLGGQVSAMFLQYAVAVQTRHRAVGIEQTHVSFHTANGFDGFV